MRAFGRLGAVPGGRPTAHAAVAAYSTFSGSGGGGGGIGRGRGRGSGPPPPRVPGQPVAPVGGDEDDLAPPGVGRGRAQPVLPSSPVLPSFSSWMSSAPPAGRGRSRFPPPPTDPSEPSADAHSRRPIFFKREDATEDHPDPVHGDKGNRLPRSLSPGFSGAGRGKPSSPIEPESRPREENRHLRQRPAPRPGLETSGKPTGQPRMGREEAVKRAVEVLSRGGPGGSRGPGRGRGGRGMMRGRGRGGRSRGRGREEEDEDISMYLGDNADGEKLEKRLGEEKMKQLNEAFEQMSWTALPSPLDDAYLEALHTNNMIEYEPEYLVDFDNPDIDEKPPMPLREALEKAKPFLMAYEGIQSQEEWEEAIEETMKKVPYMKELMDMYCGPDRVTAKQQQKELERVAKTLPENIPASVKRFADRAVLSLQSNPGWGWDKKCQFMDKLVLDVTKHYSK